MSPKAVEAVKKIKEALLPILADLNDTDREDVVGCLTMAVGAAIIFERAANIKIEKKPEVTDAGGENKG